MGVLSWLVALPLLGAAAIAFLPAARATWPRWIALAASAASVGLAASLSTALWADTHETSRFLGDLRFVEKIPWFESLGIQYFLGLDGVSAFLVDLTAIVILTGTLASWGVRERAKEFFALLLVLVAGVFGVFLSFDLFLFFLFYELAVLPMYLLIAVWGTGPKEYSAMKLTLMLMASAALLLVGFLALYSVAGTFDLARLAETPLPRAFQLWVFPVLFLGFGVLGGLFPFHTWSPDGHASAPTAVSMLHAGVLMKLGGYGILRIALPLLPEGAQHWALFFLFLTTVNIVYGSFGAIRQKDLKYFTAYSSVSHCGFMLFGLLTLNPVGTKGAVLQMVSHGIMTALFFALIGMVYGRTHTRLIPAMGGLARPLPWLATAFYIGGFASLGLPGLSGFLAESHVFLGGFLGHPWAGAGTARVLTAIATTSIVVTAVYVLRGLAAVFQGPLTVPAFGELRDANAPERLTTVILVAALAAMGAVPALSLRLIDGPVAAIVARLGGIPR